MLGTFSVCLILGVLSGPFQLGVAEPLVNQFLENLLTQAEANPGAAEIITKGIFSRRNSDLEDLQPEQFASVECALCRGLVTLVNGAIQENLGYQDLREAVMDFCFVLLTNFTQYPAEILCETTIDNYGPLVFDIVENANRTADLFCEKLLRDCAVNVTAPTLLPPTPPSVHRRPERPHKHTSAAKSMADIIVVQLTDIHIDFLYSPGSPTDCGLPTCCHSYWPGSGAAGHWGDYDCNIPTHTAELLLQSVAAMSPLPDLIIYSGDTPSHAVWEETQSGQLNASRWLADAFRRIIPNTVRIYPAMGNHETYPTNLYNLERPEIQELNREFTNWWTDLAGFSQEQIDTMNIAGYYSKMVQTGLWIIGYNSNFGATANWYNVYNDEKDPWKMMTVFLEEQLANIANSGEKVILIGHHPIGTSGMTLVYEQFLTDILVRYGSIIVLHVLGHNHVDQFRIVNSQDRVPVSVQNGCATSGARSDNNPSIRIYSLDPIDFKVLDYQITFLNITKYTSETQTPVLEDLYTASSEYGMTGFSPLDWWDLTERFLEDWDLYNKYRYNKKVRSEIPGPCNDQCRWNDVCQIRSSTYPEYLECNSNFPGLTKV